MKRLRKFITVIHVYNLIHLGKNKNSKKSQIAKILFRNINAHNFVKHLNCSLTEYVFLIIMKHLRLCIICNIYFQRKVTK